ncbi:MAG: polyprenyl synthetase family protein [Nitrososphaerales archaeon]
MSGYSELLIYKNLIDKELEFLFDENYKIAFFAKQALSKGKRFRAILALLWCEGFNQDYRLALPIAIAYELAHTAALIQDDIIDASKYRRGYESLTSKLGLNKALLLANFFLFEIPKRLLEYKGKIEEDKLYALLNIIGETCKLTTLGEYLDQEFINRDFVSEEDYIKMVKMKTGALMAAPCSCGAIVGNADTKGFNLAYTFGENLGISYQILDDMLDIFGKEDLRESFNDLRNGKKSIILIHTLKRCSKEEREFLKSFQGSEDLNEEEKRKVREIFAKYGSFEYARNLGKQYLDKALSSLEEVPNPSVRYKIKILTNFILEKFQEKLIQDKYIYKVRF